MKNSVFIKKMWSLVLAVVMLLSCNNRNNEQQISKVDTTKPLPHLKTYGESVKLIVDGKPMLLLSGELRNSASSELEYAKKSLDRCKSIGLNSVIVTISWEEFEPQEGTYDYTLIDGLIKAAEERSLKLVVIWFGSYKNGKMTYAPSWVKQDINRFKRVLSSKEESGNRQEHPDVKEKYKGQRRYKRTLSASCEATWKADAKAFTKLMERIKAVDENRTVVMIQIENEAGLQDVKLDQQPESLKGYHADVPKPMLTYLNKNKNTLTPALAKAWKENGEKTKGNWKELFGDLSYDAYGAWQVAYFMEQITAAGKAVYDIPMFYNAWVKLRSDAPGDYPTGGPIHTMLDVYRAASPSVDLLCPDLYVSEFKEYCMAYKHPGNTLFIPECRLNNDAVAKAYWAIATEDAIGFAPFAIDDAEDDFPLKEGYRILEQLQTLILKTQGTDKLKGFYRQVAPKSKTINAGAWSFDVGELDKQDEPTQRFKMGNYSFILRHNKKMKELPSYGLMIDMGNDEFIITGQNLDIFWDSDTPNKKADALSLEQGEFINGEWVRYRRLNGDSGTTRVMLPSPTDSFTTKNKQHIFKLKLYTYDAFPN